MDIKRLNTDVAVIGGGGAACFAAIEVSKKGLNCIMVDKGRPGRSGATPTAMGITQAPMGPRGRDNRDTPDQYFEDIVKIGEFIGDQNITEVVAYTAVERILDMEKYGIHFKKYDDGRFFQTPVPGSTYPRNCFIIENGQSMSTVLAKEASRRDNIEIYKDFFVFDLLKNGNTVVGILGMDMIRGEIVAINAKSTIIATGGYTALWGFSDSPPTLTGDLLSPVYRAGADIVDLEFNQYYATDVIWPPSVRRTTVSYELMGEEFADGEITDKDGVPILDKPLPTRDEAMKTIFGVIKEGRGTPRGGVYFDTTKSPKGEAAVREVFETMFSKYYNFLIDAAGIDLAKTPLEVAPGSHYQCGGMYVNERGESTAHGLYGCGEFAGNFQGANRMGGSALCEIQTLGVRTGRCAADDAKKRGATSIDKGDLKAKTDILNDFFSSKSNPVRPINIKKEILKTMDKYIAPLRDEKGLTQGLSIIRSLRNEVTRISVPDIRIYNLELREAIETNLMLDTAEITFESALFRKESRGHHNRTDYPDMDNKEWRCHTIAALDGGKPKYSKRDVIYTRLKPKDI